MTSALRVVYKSPRVVPDPCHAARKKPKLQKPAPRVQTLSPSSGRNLALQKGGIMRQEKARFQCTHIFGRLACACYG